MIEHDNHEEKTFSVAIQLDVTAERKEQALDYAVSDINELHRSKTLQADIQCIDDGTPSQTDDAMHQLINEYIAMYAESNNLQLTKEQCEAAHAGVAYWLTETLPDAVSDSITNIT